VRQKKQSILGCIFALLLEVIVIFAFDTLGFTKRLRDAGVTGEHAEAHAEAARDFIMTELATRSDFLALKSDLLALKADVTSLKDTVALKSDLMSLRSEFMSFKETASLKTDLVAMRSDMVAMRNELQAAIEKSTLQTTVRLGGIVALGVGLLAALVRMH
jgi:hypothetical protein